MAISRAGQRLGLDAPERRLTILRQPPCTEFLDERSSNRAPPILVERGLRGQGLAAIALHGAVELIAQAGGGVVEGYPHDTGGVRKKNSSFLYNGTRTMYELEGFTYDRPKGQGNCVMVREVAPSPRE
jgi:hypothetical protein